MTTLSWHDPLFASQQTYFSGAEIERRMAFEVNYLFDCKDYNGNQATKKLIDNSINQNFIYLVELCDGSK